MKKLVFLIASFYALTANAQNYLITFAGSGAATTVSSVKVENLTAGTSLTLNGSDILRLTGTVGINEVENSKTIDIVIYPNPMDEYSILQIYPPVAGNAVISVLDMSGKLVTQISSYIDNQIEEYRLSGLNHGSYLITVKGRNFHYSSKLISIGQGGGKVSLEKMSNNRTSYEKVIETASKGEFATVDMNYTNGDRLKFTGISGIYSMIKMDIPEGSKTITFNFLACTDGDGINYPIVDIGGQIWMAENLKTTKYRDGTNITYPGIDNVAWQNNTNGAYSWYNNDETSNKNVYGALYNWFVVINSHHLCPTGWHVPTNAELTTLTTFLGGESIAGGKLKETGFMNWQNPNFGATNETGFSAIPGGFRASNNGTFSNIKVTGFWWSSNEFNVTTAWYRYLSYSIGEVNGGDNGKNNGFSVRCVKDN